MPPKQSEKKIVLESHSKSLYNISQAPGWTEDENEVLRLCIMKFGLGQWTRMRKLGVLPGKVITQLYLHTQRHLGQQSLGAFLNLKIDPEKVRVHNEAKKEEEGVAVKGGIILNNGENPTRESRLKQLEENRNRFQLTAEEVDEVSEIEIFKVKRKKRIQFTEFLETYLKLKQEKKSAAKAEEDTTMEEPNHTAVETKITAEQAQLLENQITEQKIKVENMIQEYLQALNRKQQQQK